MAEAREQPPSDLADLTVLREELDDDELVGELIESFIEEGDRRMLHFAEAAESGDFGRASAIAHALKGSASHFGAHRLVAVCAELEHSRDSGSPVERSALIQAVRAEYGRVRTYLRSCLNGL